MFNMGFSELLILGALALIFIGPEQLPEIAKVIGRALNEWKRASSELQNHLLREDSPPPKNQAQSPPQEQTIAPPPPPAAEPTTLAAQPPPTVPEPENKE